MKKSMVFMGVILGLFLTAFPWPETQVGATQSTPTLMFKKNSFKTFSLPSMGEYITFEASVPNTTGDFADGSYTSFVVDVLNTGLSSTILMAYKAGSKFKIDYVKDASFMGRSVMVVKVFTLQE